MKRTLIHNATIVNEGQSTQGAVVIENGRIAEVLTNWKPLSAPCEEVIDATCCYLLPGISIMEVTPPAAAAELSVRISALWVSPGSRKCT